jgi:hypothetical protein
MKLLIRYLKHHHIALLALFIVLGGTSYAAVALPRNSVGPKQITKDAVTSAKVKNGSLRSIDFAAGQLPQGARGEVGPAGPRGASGTNGANGRDATTNLVTRMTGILYVLGGGGIGGSPTIGAAQRADCLTGERAINGGFEMIDVGDTTGATIPITNRAATDNRGWVVRMENYSLGYKEFRVYVTCATP